MDKKISSAYLSDNSRLADVIAAIQVMGTYKFYKLSFADWADRISADKSKEEHWRIIFEEHPEFFRLDTNRQKASLVWRRQYPKRFYVDTENKLTKEEVEKLPVEIRNTRISRNPLSSSDIGTLIKTAVDLHTRALELVEKKRWWIPIVSGSAAGGLLGAVLGALLK